jgi:hypothetical protein
MVYRHFFESELEKKKYDYSKEAVEDKKKYPAIYNTIFRYESEIKDLT